MLIDYAAKVDIGPKETNDDRILVDGSILDMNAHSGTVSIPSIAIVCDGCGGYMGGGIAAHAVLGFISREEVGSLTDPNYLSQVLDNCQHVINDQKNEMPHYSEMCTTIAGCVFCEDCTIIFHSGDSRVYRYDKWGIARMTKDHSVVQDLIDMGEISPEEALIHPKRNVITRCIGVEGRPPEIYLSRTPINPEEKYLLCSDGVWESVSDEEIKDILDSDLSLQQMVDTLVEKALRQGADDNVSVCICAGQGKTKAVENKPFILD